jgi:hypothetical protein
MRGRRVSPIKPVSCRWFHFGPVRLRKPGADRLAPMEPVLAQTRAAGACPFEGKPLLILNTGH